MRPALALCVLCLCGSAFLAGAAAAPAPTGPVTVRIVAATNDPSGSRVEQIEHRFVLTCNPTGGTLPLAARVCRAIARHPVAMLDPPPERETCIGEVSPESVSLRTTVGGRTTRAAGVPGCTWPGSARFGVYLAAPEHDEKALGTWERRLHCDEDRVLLAADATLEAHLICEFDQIRIATRLPALARVQAARRFPRNLGTRRCTLVPGSPGACTIAWSSVPAATLTFTATWAKRGVAKRHVWRVAFEGTRSARVLSERGAPLA